MVADTYSARLGALEMGTGNQNNSWGTSFNSSVTDVLDRAIAGSITRTVTGGTLDLSGSPPPAAMRQDIDLMQIIVGALTSNQTIIVPNLSKTWAFYNGCTGAFQLFIQVAGSSNVVQIPANTVKYVVMIGSASILRLDREHVGNLLHHGGTTAPSGALACNGASLLRADYPDLFGVIGTTWGAADATHFTLPLLTDTGRFLRSSSGSLTVGTYQSNQNLAHTHTVTGAPAVNSLGTDNPGNHTHANTLTDLGHTHNTTIPTTSGNTGGGGSFGNAPASSLTGNNNTTPMSITNAAAGAHTHTVTGTLTVGTLGTASSGGTEARPESAVVLICIKY